MSNCKDNFNHFENACNREESNSCTIGSVIKPRLLTLLTNAVFDETSIHLCKSEVIMGNEVNIDFNDFCCAQKLEIRVLDLCTDDSTVHYMECKPNCVHVKLTKLKGKFEGKLLDGCGNILTTFIFYADFLSDCPRQKDCKCDCCKADKRKETVCADLYAPNGVTYDGKEPIISFLGFDADNSFIKQGIVLQAEAEAVKICIGEPLCGQTKSNLIVSMDLNLVLKSVYAVEYKFCHEGVSTPTRAE